MGIQVQGVDAVKAKLARLAKAHQPHTVWVDMPPEEVQRLQWLVHGRFRNGKRIQPPRDLFQVTPDLATAMVRAFTNGLVRVASGSDWTTPWVAAGQVYLDKVRQRWKDYPAQPTTGKKGSGTLERLLSAARPRVE